MAQILWELLGSLSNQKQLVACVTLLYQIHNTFDGRLFVDHVIGRHLCEDTITADYVKRFFLLWHLGRDLDIKLPAHKTTIRNFDRYATIVF